MRPDSLDPYCPPELPAGFRPVKQQATVRTWLLAIAIVTLVLSAISALSAVSGALTACFPSAILQSGGKTGNAALDTAQATLHQGLIDLYRKHFALILSVSVATVIACGVAFAGGIFALRTPPRYRTLFLVGCLAFMASEILQVGAFFVLQSQSMELIETFVEDVASANNPGGPPLPIAAVAKIGMYVSFVLTLIYLLAKMGFFTYAVFFLRRENVQRLYAGETTTDVIQAEVAKAL